MSPPTGRLYFSMTDPNQPRYWHTISLSEGRLCVLDGCGVQEEGEEPVSDEENCEMDADPSSSEEDVPFNITDEMKRMFHQLWVLPESGFSLWSEILSCVLWRHHVEMTTSADRLKQFWGELCRFLFFCVFVT